MSESIQTILVVDDLAHCRAWLARAVARAFPDACIETADSLAGALSGLRSEPDLVLLDLGLPDGDGSSIIREIKRRLPAAHVVISTVFDDDGHLYGALRAGADGYLLKDDDFTEIADLLREILAGKPPLSASIARRLLRHFAAPEPAPSSTADLTPREGEVLQLIAKGLNVPRVAELLGISRHTVGGYLKDVYRKLQVTSRAEATMEAARRGFVR